MSVLLKAINRFYAIPIKISKQDLPGGAVVKNPSANAGDTV